MATFEIPIVGSQAGPDASGDVFQEPSTIKLTTDIYDELAFVFNDSNAKDSLSVVFRVPPNYVGTPKILFPWVSTATSGNVRWVVDITAVAPGELWQRTTHGATGGTIQDAAEGTATDLAVAEVSLTAGDYTAGDLVKALLSRESSHAEDTMAAAAILIGAWFSYTDS
jgi:hypothetical protein